MDVRVWLRSNWERSLGVVCLVGGSAATAGSFLGVRSSRFLIEDLSYLLSGGVGGLLLIGVGATLLVTGHLHLMRQDLLRVADTVRSAMEREVLDLPDFGSEAEPSPAPSADVSSPNGLGEALRAAPTPARMSAN